MRARELLSLAHNNENDPKLSVIRINYSLALRVLLHNFGKDAELHDGGWSIVLSVFTFGEMEDKASVLLFGCGQALVDVLPCFLP